MVFFRSKQKELRKHVEELTDPDPEVRMRAAYELSTLEAQEAVPHLKKALSDADKRVRWRAAYALGDHGEMGSGSAFQALATHLEVEKDWNVRRIIVMALRHWDEQAIKPLINALSDESEYVRRYAAMTLGYKKAKQAVGLLKILAAEDKSKEVRDYSEWALKKIQGY